MPHRRPTLLRAASLLALVGVLSGCSFYRDLDKIPLREADASLDASTPADVGDAAISPDAGDAADASDAADAADIGIDVGPCGLPAPWTSDADFGDPTRNRCDPVEPIDRCDGSTQARCSLNIFADTSPPEMRATCIYLSQFGSLADGELCGDAVQAAGAETKCQSGLFCTPWPAFDSRDPRLKSCARLCEMDDDRGCLGDDFCVQVFPEVPGVGLCVPSCDPYDAESCKVGEICAPDFGYPTTTKTPRFRCRPDVQNPNAPAAAYGEACSMGSPRLPYRGCDGSNVCYPRTPGQAEEQATCERPCRADADCAELGAGFTCPECGEGPWDLRFCQSSEQ